MEMSRAGAGRMVQLETGDSVEKVTDWYTERLKPKETVKIPGREVILKSDEMTAIISGKGNRTTILLKQGED
jgi:hypothetical protein